MNFGAQYNFNRILGYGPVLSAVLAVPAICFQVFIVMLIVVVYTVLIFQASQN